MACRHGAEVTGVTVIDLRRLANVGPVPVGAGAAAAELAEHRIHVTEERIEQAIADFETECARVGVVHQVVREECDALDELKSLWRYHDLVVFGLRGLFEYGVVHNPDDTLTRLIAHGVRPILAVSPEYREIKRVLVAYDGSMDSAAAMKRFVRMCYWPDVTFRTVTFSRKVKHAQQLLSDAAEYFKAHGIQTETDFVEDSAREHLLSYAEGWGADLIVMGASSRARILRHVMGDTVLKAIRESHVPLFLMQ
jgi:nucleotide-binding universal stress UspA family protein